MIRPTTDSLYPELAAQTHKLLAATDEDLRASRRSGVLAFMPGRPFFGRDWFPFWGACRVGLGRFAGGMVGLVERRFDCTSSLCWIPLEASEAFVFLRPPAAEYNGSEKAQLVAEPQQIAFPVAPAKWLRVRVSPAGFWLIFQAGPPTARQPRCS